MRLECVSSEFGRCRPRLLAQRLLSGTCVQSVALGLPLPSLLSTSRLLQSSLSTGLGPAEPSLAGTCATRPRPSCSCPAPTPAAVPGHWPRSSGSLASTWRETNPPAAYACPGRSCPPSPTFGDHTLGTA